MDRSSERPRSITILCWFIVVHSAAGIGLLFLGRAAGGGQGQMLDPAIVKGVSVISLLATVFFGAQMLQGKNWARWGYIGVFGAFVLGSVLVATVKIPAIATVLVYSLIVYILRRPVAEAWFTGKPPPEAP